MWSIVYAVSLFTGVFLAQLTAILGLILGVTALLKGWSQRPMRHDAIYPLGVAIAVLLLSALLNRAPVASLEFLARHYGVPLLGFAGAVILMRSAELRAKAFNTIAVVGALSGGYGIFQHFTGLDPLYGQQLEPISAYHLKTFLPVGLLDMALTYAGVQLSALLLVVPVAWTARGKRARWLWISAIVMFLSIFLTYRRGPLLVGVGVIGLFLVTRSRRTAIVTVIAAAVLAVCAWFASPALRQAVGMMVEVKGVSVGQRVVLWDAALQMGSDHPLLGVGPGHWRDRLGEYIEDPTSQGGRSFAHAHSDPMQLWATTGAMGVLAVAAIQAVLLLVAFRDLRGHPAGGFDRDIYLGGVFSDLGFVLASFGQCYMMDAENILMLAGVLAMMLGARERLLARGTA